MRHHSGMSVPDSGYARRTGGMNSFLGSVFLQMAASFALSAVSALLVLKVQALRHTTPDLVCTVDPAHRVEPAAWSGTAWRPRLSGPLHPDGLAALARRLGR